MGFGEWEECRLSEPLGRFRLPSDDSPVVAAPRQLGLQPGPVGIDDDPVPAPVPPGMSPGEAAVAGWVPRSVYLALLDSVAAAQGALRVLAAQVAAQRDAEAPFSPAVEDAVDELTALLIRE